MMIESEEYIIKYGDQLQQNIDFRPFFISYIFNLQTNSDYFCLNNVKWTPEYTLKGA